MDEGIKALLVISPNDRQIGEAIQRIGEKEACAVETFAIDDVSTIADDLRVYIGKQREQIRVNFTESAWGSIPRVHRRATLDLLLDHDNVHCVHFSKK